MRIGPRTRKWPPYLGKMCVLFVLIAFTTHEQSHIMYLQSLWGQARFTNPAHPGPIRDA